MAHEEPMLHPMGGQSRLESLFAEAFLQLSEHVPLRAHLSRVPMRDLAGIHLKAVMMLRHRHHILCAGLRKQLRPFIGIKILRPEHGNEVLVAEFRVLSIGLHMMLEFPRILYVHIAGIPFAAKARNAVDSPMDENAELGVSIPFRHLIAGQGLPGILIGPLRDNKYGFMSYINLYRLSNHFAFYASFRPSMGALHKNR